MSKVIDLPRLHRDEALTLHATLFFLGEKLASDASLSPATRQEMCDLSAEIESILGSSR